jgi:hypothetical protein
MNSPLVVSPDLVQVRLVTPMDSTADEENWSSSGNMMELFRSQGGLGGFQLSVLTKSNKPSSSPRSAIVSFMRRVREMQVLEVECSSVGREASMDTQGVMVMELRARTVTETSSRVSATTSALVFEVVVVKLVLGFHGVRMMEKSNMYREVAELYHGGILVVEIVYLAWLAVVSTLGMTRKENGLSTLLISLRRGNINRGGPIIELAKYEGLYITKLVM